jgi:NADH:ubiquinone oxidoreductase subunit H
MRKIFEFLEILVENISPNFLIGFFWTIIPLVKIICILISVAYFTISERKIMAAIQRRLGPNVEGYVSGFIQPIADGLKLFFKELILPNHTNFLIFILAPFLIFILSLTIWSIIPFGINSLYEGFYMRFLHIKWNLSNIYVMLSRIWDFPFFFGKRYESLQHVINFSHFPKNLFSNNSFGILFILTISSLNVYGIILGGWASNSKYASLGAIRSGAQMISYEITISLTILPIVLLSGSFNLAEILVIQQKTIWYIFPLLPLSFIFFISMLAETNRAPFDSPEAEAELVAGYNVEYSSMLFALYFLGEYSNMLLMSVLFVIFFLGGGISFTFFNSFDVCYFIPAMWTLIYSLDREAFSIFYNIIGGFIFSVKLILICFIYIYGLLFHAIVMINLWILVGNYFYHLH